MITKGEKRHYVAVKNISSLLHEICQSMMMALLYELTCVYSLFTHRSFDNNKHKPDFYRGADAMRKFWRTLWEHTTEIINSEGNAVANNEGEKCSIT